MPGQRHSRQQAEAALEREPIRRPCGGYGLGLEEKQSITQGPQQGRAFGQREQPVYSINVQFSSRLGGAGR